VTEAIILAGGLGTRLRAVVPDLPKPMAIIDGKPFLQHQMDYWINQGVSRFVISVGFLRHKIIEHFQFCYRNIEIEYAEEVEPLGTGGGLLLAYRKLKSNAPFLVLNGDTFFEVNLADMQAFHVAKKAIMTMALFKVTANDRYMGVRLNDDSSIVQFKSEPGMSQLANGGVYLMAREIFANIPWQTGDKLSLEEHLFQYLLDQNEKLSGLVFDGRFIDIGVPSDYYRASQVIGEKYGY